MEIKQFIETTISEIIAAVESSGSVLHDVGMYHEKVNFDLAVTASTASGSDSTRSGGGSIRIAEAKLQSHKSTTEEERAVSRVKFEITISKKQSHQME